MEEAFLFLLFIFVFIIFIILLGVKSSAAFNQRMVMKRLDELRNEISKLKSVENISAEPLTIKKEVLVFDKKPDVIIKPETVIKDEKPIEPVIEVKKEQVFQEVKIEQKQVAEQLNQTLYQSQKSVQKTQPIQKKTDFEKFIGENLLNKIGMVVLVIALIFFGKYAVDKGWLNESAKVTAIVLIGGVLIGIAHRLRTNYRAFSSVLAGGGIAALYIAIAVGFQLYGLFSQTAAFLILIVITIFAVLLALAYDKKYKVKSCYK